MQDSYLPLGQRCHACRAARQSAGLQSRLHLDPIVLLCPCPWFWIYVLQIARHSKHHPSSAMCTQSRAGGQLISNCTAHDGSFGLAEAACGPTAGELAGTTQQNIHSAADALASFTAAHLQKVGLQVLPGMYRLFTPPSFDSKYNFSASPAPPLAERPAVLRDGRHRANHPARRRVLYNKLLGQH